jgi:hypothetical protein
MNAAMQNPIGTLAIFGILATTAAAQTFTQRVATGLSYPVYVTNSPNDADRLFIIERTGVIKILNLAAGTINASPFLTIADADTQTDGGIISMAFHPDYATNGKFYVYVTIDNGGIDGSPFSSHIRCYEVSAGDPDIADTTPTEILNFVQPLTNHNAGWIGFNPKVNPEDPQYLYITSGDGGKQHDPDNNAQMTTNNLLGKILRIDVDADDFSGDPDKNYAIPSTNPFVGVAGDDEIWAYGLRNPWRASFDRDTGDFYIGDVGQDDREEINRQPAASLGGENYAWNRREGFQSHQGGALLPGDTDPIYDYIRTGDFGGRSVVGGYVYRGFVPEFQGLYIFADTILDNIWSFDPADPINTVDRINDDLLPDVGSIGQIVSFGEDAAGNLYLVDYGITTGEIYRISKTCYPADRDCDNDVDGVDFSIFASCFNNAGNPPRTIGCDADDQDALDFDNDVDVDGVDFAVFAACFNKAGNPPRTTGCPSS